MASDVAKMCDSLKGVWGVMQHQTTQLGLMRGEVRETRRAVTEARDASSAIPVAAVVQSTPLVSAEQPESCEQAVDVQDVSGLEFDHDPVATQVLPTTDREYLVERLPPLSSEF